jgi:hypothetical protein
MLQGGVGIELWTMTEDILFDNIYVGHSVEDANAFAAETFDIKKALEELQSKFAGDAVDEDSDDEFSFDKFKSDPMGFIRQKIFMFIDLVKIDPILAFKTYPETGAGLAGALFTLFGMIGALFGLVGASQKPITKVSISTILYQVDLSLYPPQSSKKTDAATPDDKKKVATTPVAPAGDVKKEEGSVKRRAGK